MQWIGIKYKGINNNIIHPKPSGKHILYLVHTSSEKDKYDGLWACVRNLRDENSFLCKMMVEYAG